MREIKFRVWDRNKGDMFYFDNCHFNSEYCLLAFDISNKPEYSYGDLDCEYENSEIMQFTGLKDKNGKEIYEGDIIKYNFCNKDFIEKVPNINCHHWFDELISDETEIELIGNIFENPELIK